MPEDDSQMNEDGKAPEPEVKGAGATPEPEAGASTEGAAAEERQKPRGKVLLADDVAVMRNLLVRALRNAGYTVAEARNGSHVLEMVAKERPDLIVMDNMMPVMSGPECLRRLKASPETQDIPVIMCTAKTEKHDVLDAARGGAADYIVKPFKIETVLDRVAKHMPANHSQSGG